MQLKANLKIKRRAAPESPDSPFSFYRKTAQGTFPVKLPAVGEEVVDGVAGRAGGGHGQNDGGGTGDDVAAGPDPGLHGFPGLGVGHDITPLVEGQARS